MKDIDRTTLGGFGILAFGLGLALGCFASDPASWKARPLVLFLIAVGVLFACVLGLYAKLVKS